MIRLITGPARSGKSHAVYQEFHDKICSGKAEKAILVVPEQYTLEAEKQYLDHSKAPGILGAEIISFKRLCFRVLEEVGMHYDVPITEIGRLMLLRNLFESHHSELVYYQNVYERPGFLFRFYELVKELRQSMAGTEALEKLKEQLDEESLLYHKLSDLTLVYHAYAEATDGLYSDDEDYYAMMLDGIGHSQKIKDTWIWVDGFDSFTAQEYEIIRALTEQAKQVTVTVPIDDGYDSEHGESVFLHTATMLKRLEKMASEIGLPIERVTLDRAFESKALEYLSKAVFRYPYSAYPAQKDQSAVHVFSAENRMAEVEQCALEMIRLVRDEHFEWRDLAVVSNDLSAYEMAVKRVFDRYELPYFMDAKSAMRDNPLIDFILALCRTGDNLYGEENAVQLLKTGFFDVEDEAVFQFELYVRAWRLRERQLCKPFEKPAPEGVHLEAAESVRAFYCEVTDDIRQLKRVPAQHMAETLYRVMVALKLPEKIEAQVDRFMEKGDFDHAQTFAQVWNRVMTTLDELVGISGEALMSLSDVYTLLEAGFERMETGRIPLRENQVLVGSLDRSRAHPIRTLFILGVNDGVLPQSGGDHQLILEEEKARLKTAGFHFLADSQMFLEKEQYNIYSAMTRPSESIYFSYSRADEEGKPLRASQWIGRVLKCFPDAEMKTPLKPIATEKGTAAPLASELRRALDGYPISEEWLEVFKWYMVNAPETAKHLYRGLKHSNLVDRLSKRTVEALYKGPLNTSVSRLENYVQCPFKYYVEAGLRPTEIHPYTMSYPEVGTLLHQSLERFGRRLNESETTWKTLDGDSAEALMASVVDELLDDELYRSKFQYRYQAHKLMRVSKRAVRTLTQHLHQGAFEPIAFELAFPDSGKGLPPIVIELNSGEKLFIRGVIDRIDRLDINGKTYLKIIDYKSGSKKISLSDVYHGLQMQLLVYLGACMGSPAYFRADDVHPAGAFYFRIDDPLVETPEQVKAMIDEKITDSLKLDGFAVDDADVLNSLDETLQENGRSSVIQVRLKTDQSFAKTSQVVSESDLLDMITWVQKKIAAIGEDVLEGHIDISPCRMGTAKSCDYCDYKGICQFDTQFLGNTYRKLPTMDDETVLSEIRTGEKS